MLREADFELSKGLSSPVLAKQIEITDQQSCRWP